MGVFTVQCPNCGVSLEADEKYIGARAACAGCDFHFILQKVEEEIVPVIELRPVEKSAAEAKDEYIHQDDSVVEYEEFSFVTPPANLTFAKPISLLISGEIIAVNSWTDILCSCFNYALTYRSAVVLSSFLDKENNLFTKKRIISASAANLRQPRKLSENVFLETNYSAINVIKIVCGLIKLCDLSPERFSVRYIAKNTNVQRAVQKQKTKDEKFSDKKETIKNQKKLPAYQNDDSSVKYEKFSFVTPPADLTFAKPISLLISGENLVVKSWNDILYICFNYALTHRSTFLLSSFLNKENNLFTKKRILGTSTTNMRLPRELSKNVFLETNFSANNIIKIVCELTKFCDLSPERFSVRYVIRNTNIQSSFQKQKNKDEKYSDKTDEINNQKILASSRAIDIEEIKAVICQEFNNGFVFNTGAIKILENVLGRDCSDVEQRELKRLMFKRTDDVFLLPEMVADINIIADITDRIKEYFAAYGCFSLSVLYDEFSCNLKNLTNPDSDFRLFLLNVILPTLPDDGKIFGRSQCQICIPGNVEEDEITHALAERIKEMLERYGDAMFIEDLDNELPYLNSSALEMILQENIADAIEIKVDGMSYWKLIEFFCLPDDFAEYLQLMVSSMEQAQTAPSLQTLSEALELQYGEGFREIYAVDDDDVFKQIIKVSMEEDGYSWNRNVFVKQNFRHELNVADEFLKTQQGIFHESEFFDYASTHRGLTNTSMLILTFLRNKCIRLDHAHWISLSDFDNLSNFSTDMAESITRELDLLRGTKAFLPLGTLADAFLSSLPVLTINEQVFYWNHYSLASIATHRMSKIKVINDEPSPYTVTAMSIPLEVDYQGDVVDYVFNDLKNNHRVFSSADEVFEYLQKHQVRIVKAKKLLARIRQFWGLE